MALRRRPELLVVLARPVGPPAACAEALLREVLAELTGTAAADHVFVRTCDHCGDDAHGKPILQHPSLHTSRSSAADAVAVAVSSAGPVGVDVEQVTAASFAGFDEVALGPAEQAGSPTERARAWTRKEAVLKARGTGLRVDPRTVDVTGSRLAGRPPVHLFDVPCGLEFACAAAVLSERRPRLQREERDLSR